MEKGEIGRGRGREDGTIVLLVVKVARSKEEAKGFDLGLDYTKTREG